VAIQPFATNPLYLRTLPDKLYRLLPSTGTQGTHMLRNQSSAANHIFNSLSTSSPPGTTLKQLAAARFVVAALFRVRIMLMLPSSVNTLPANFLNISAVGT
jgi:hypothetical protein